MKFKIPLAVLPALLFVLSSNVYAQKQQKIKFGQPLMEELQMTGWDADTSAAAVVLYKKGFFNAKEFRFHVHVRVKILKPSGTEHGNFRLRVPYKSEIEGRTYNLENGQIVAAKLENSNVFREDITKELFLYKVFFPNVKAGSVVDLLYSHGFLPGEWSFQDVIPVKYNELTLEESQYLFFKKTMFGLEKIQQISPWKWTAENLPAVTKEPYMPHYTNYITKFKFDLESISVPGRVYRDYATTWERVAQVAMESDFFGGLIRNAAFLNDKAKEIKESGRSVNDKILEAYKYIQENIKWNDYESEYASEWWREDFKTRHSGNSAEVNLLLVSLLKKADLKAYPVLMSTRSNGLLNQFSASPSSLNYVIACIKDGNNMILLDACMKNGRPGILPEYCLNLYGLLIGDNNSIEWIDLQKSKPYRRREFIQVALNSDGHAKADISSTFEDYAYLDWIATYDKTSDDPQKMSIALSGSEAEIVSDYKVVTIDKQKLNSQDNKIVDLTNTEYFQEIGNEYILTPFVMNDFENPFNATTRKFPVDFNYPINKSIIAIVSLPENVVIRQAPESVTLVPEHGGARFNYIASVAGNRLQIRADLIVEKQFFTEDQYLSLKNFFSEVGRKMATPIQIDKKI